MECHAKFIVISRYLIANAFQVVLVVKNWSANAGDLKDLSSIPWSGRSPGGGHGSPLQYSCLEYLTDREVWRDTICRVTKSQIKLKQLRMNVFKCSLIH